MEKSKPIKRSEAIAEFSRDHHFALLLTFKIREGLKKSADLLSLRNSVLDFFETDLKAHFKSEEELLFSRLSPDHELRLQAEREHQGIYTLIESFKESPASIDLLEKFSTDLDKHIRFEERQLFNYLQEHVSETDLQEIASIMKDRHGKNKGAKGKVC